MENITAESLTDTFKIKNLWKKAVSSSMFNAALIVFILLGTMLILTPNYLSSKNVYQLAKVLTVTALIGFSQMICIALGGLNVSVGAVGALSAVVAGGVMDVMDFPAGRRSRNDLKHPRKMSC